METIIPAGFVWKSRYSDPTYEAWKHKSQSGNKKATRNSDPTYEAWKPASELYDLIDEIDSDPTYEAWKQDIR